MIGGGYKVKKKFEEAEIEITQYNITSAVTTSDLAGEEYPWIF